MNNVIEVGDIKIANNLPFVLFAGPCQIENLDHSLYMAESLIKIASKLAIPFIYKSSFDKANRTSSTSKRGVGLIAGLEILSKVKANFNCPIVTDVHNENQCEQVAEVVDILQIPAFLCRQTDLLKAAAETGKIIKVKKGQFLAPWDMQNVYNKIRSFGNSKIILTERGASFGYNTLVSDMRSLPIMAETGAPVVYDATHSVQKPGVLGGSSSGERKYVEILAKAALAVGVAGIFAEVHQDPDNAPSDGDCMLKLGDLETILKKLKEIDVVVKRN